MSNSPAPQTPQQTAPEPTTEHNIDLDRNEPFLGDAPGRRTSSSLDLLIIEAELVAEGKRVENPAIPGDEIFEDVLQRLEGRGLEPAWIACRNEGDE